MSVESCRRYYKKNAKKWRTYNRQWRAKHPEKVKEHLARQTVRRKSDVNCKIIDTLRKRLSVALRAEWKTGSTTQLLGCSIPDFKIYLESLWESGMTWENYGRHGWHIDHIVPCALFDLSKQDHQRRCFHFSNMRPMWVTENLGRGIHGHHQFKLL